MSAETHEGTSVSALTPKSEWKKWVGLQSRARLMTKWPLTVGCGRNSKSDRMAEQGWSARLRMHWAVSRTILGKI